MHHAARPAAARTLRTASQRPDRTGRKGNSSHALGPCVPRTGVDVSPQIFPGARNLALLRGQSRGRLQAVSGRRPHRDHHHRRHARAAAAARQSSAVHPRADPDRARPLSQLFRARPARHLAAGMRLCRRRRNFFAGGEHPLVHPRHARRAARAPASALRHVCAGLHAQRHRRFRARLRFLAAGLEQARRLSRRRDVTAIFTATSASTWISTTSNRICPRRTTAVSPA